MGRAFVRGFVWGLIGIAFWMLYVISQTHPQDFFPLPLLGE